LAETRSLCCYRDYLWLEPFDRTRSKTDHRYATIPLKPDWVLTVGVRLGAEAQTAVVQGHSLGTLGSRAMTA
jgi:hypothetical protein